MTRNIRLDLGGGARRAAVDAIESVAVIRRPSSLSVATGMSLLAVVAAHIEAAGAQATSSSAAAPAVVATTETPTEVEEIIVTARRVSEDLQRTPVAVTAISAAAVQATGSRDITDVARLSPNLSIGTQSSAPTPAFYIRGVGQDRQGLSFDEGVGLYIDDIYYARSQGANLKLLDIEQVEVRRGPQGTLFGRNNIGGNIDFLTKQPNGDFGGYFQSTFGRFNRVDVDGSINAPITDNFFVKLTAGSFNQDGFVQHVNDTGANGGDNNQSARLQFRYLPTDDLTVDLGFDYIHDRSTGMPVVITAANPNASYVKGAAAHGQPLFTNDYVSTARYTEYGGGPSDYYRDDYYGGYLKLQYQLIPGIRLRSITALSRNKEMNFFDYSESPIPIDLQTDRYYEKSIQQENQILGEAFDNRLNWIAGFFYFYESPSYIQLTSDYTSYPARLGHFLRSQAQKVHSYAGYAQASYNLIDKLTVTAGVRYSYDEKSLTSIAPIVASIGGGQFGQNGTLVGTNSANWSNASPHVSLDYQWTPSIMTYVSATEGFRSGGFNTNLNANLMNNGIVPYRPETLWNYEAGVRSELFARRLRLNLTGFYQKYKDLQLTAIDLAVATPAVPAPNEITNAGREHQYGVELESEAVITKDFILRVEASGLWAHYEELGPAAGIGNPPLTLQSPLARAPRHQGSVGGQYTVHLPQEAALVFNLNYAWTASQYSNPTPSNQAYLPFYGLLDTRVSFIPGSGKWTVGAWGTNLTDKYYYVGGVDFGREGIIGMDQRVLGRPREYGVDIRANF